MEFEGLILGKKFWDVDGFKEGGFFDLSSLRGSLRNVIASFVGFFALWYLGDLSRIFGGNPSENQVELGKKLAIILGGGSILVSMTLFFLLAFSVVRLRHSCKGQWYESISKEDLYSEESRRCENENNECGKGGDSRN